MKTKVVTYQSPRGAKLTLCRRHQRERRDDWPKDRTGQEYCTVSHGAHYGRCDLCDDQ